MVQVHHSVDCIANILQSDTNTADWVQLPMGVAPPPRLQFTSKKGLSVSTLFHKSPQLLNPTDPPYMVQVHHSVDCIANILQSDTNTADWVQLPMGVAPPPRLQFTSKKGLSVSTLFHKSPQLLNPTDPPYKCL